MDLPIWIVWIFLAVLFLLADVLARGGLGICLAFGALAAAIAALYGLAPIWQWVAFLLAGSLLVVLFLSIQKQ